MGVRVGLLGALCIGAGCQAILGIEDPQIAPPGDGPIDATPMEEIDAAPLPDASPFLCTASELSGATVTSVPFDTRTTPAAEVSCGVEGPSAQFLWTPPAGGFYVLDTFGSLFDTTLAVATSCELSDELACNNDAAGGSQSEVVLEVERSAPVVVTVGGFAGATGTGVLNIAPVECPDGELTGVTFPAELSVEGAGDDFRAACAVGDFNDRAFLFRAPSAGLYRFSARGQFAIALSLIEGPRCQDEVLVCHRDNFASEVARHLEEGQLVTLQVDGTERTGLPNFGEDFTLNVEQVPGMCPQADIEANTGTATTLTPEHLIVPSCGKAERTPNADGTAVPVPTAVFRLRMPALDGQLFCTARVSLDGPPANNFLAAAILEDGDCSGREFECKISEGSPEQAAFQLVGRGEPYDVTLVVSDNREDGIGGGLLPILVELDCSANLASSAKPARPEQIAPAGN